MPEPTLCREWWRAADVAGGWCLGRGDPDLHGSLSLAIQVRLVHLVVGLMVVVGLGGQAGAEGGSGRFLSDEAEVSVLTMLPGDEVHSHWGHTAIRVHDPGRPGAWGEAELDVVFNFGTFDFYGPGFVVDFVFGRLDYYLSVQSMESVMMQYRAEGRAMVEQVLNMTGEEKERLFASLVENAEPGNRVYRYEILRDNCTTRVRDAVWGAWGLGEGEAELPFFIYNLNTGSFQDSAKVETFRSITMSHLGHDWLLETVCSLGMGLPVDQPVTRWESLFLPIPLHEALAGGTFLRDGQRVGMVSRERWLVGSPEDLERVKDVILWSDGSGNIPWFVLLLALMAVMLWGTELDRYVTAMGARFEKRRPNGWVAAASSRWAAGVSGSRMLPITAWLDVPLLAALGLGGGVLVMMMSSEHVVTQWNLNIIWAVPTHLLASAVLARSLWRSRGLGGKVERLPRWLRWYLMAAGVACGLVLVGHGLHELRVWSYWPQSIPSIGWLLALLAGLRLWRLGRGVALIVETRRREGDLIA